MKPLTGVVASKCSNLSGISGSTIICIEIIVSHTGKQAVVWRRKLPSAVKQRVRLAICNGVIKWKLFWKDVVTRHYKICVYRHTPRLFPKISMFWSCSIGCIEEKRETLIAKSIEWLKVRFVAVYLVQAGLAVGMRRLTTLNVYEVKRRPSTLQCSLRDNPAFQAIGMLKKLDGERTWERTKRL